MRRAILAVALAAACGSTEAPRSDDAGPAAAVVTPPKVSKPTTAALAALAVLKEPRAVLFFTPGPVADQVVGYLTDLGKQAGVAFEVRELDRLTAIEEARRFKVVRDGVVVLVSGDVTESFDIHTDGPEAAADLARLDALMARALGKLARGRRTIALVKHEVADIDRTRRFREGLRAAGFEVETLVPGNAVPAGAIAIFLDSGAGPTRPAMQSIDRHLAAGGAALVAMEARPGASLGPLEARLGLALADGVLVDPVAHAVAHKDASDQRLIVTSRVGAHASVATVARMQGGPAILFADAGALVERGTPAAGAARTVTVRSMPSAFLADRGGSRRRGRASAFPIAAAVSGPCKAIVVADASWLSDDLLGASVADLALLADGVRWLAGEEVMVEAAPATPAEGDQLTSYPLRTLPGGTSAGGRAALWKVAPDGVRGVRFDSRGRIVLLERKEGGLWGHFERPSPDGPPVARDLPLGAEGDALFSALAAPAVLRTVGPLDATTRARYGLEDGTLTVDVAGGATHTVLVGSRVMGGNDRYAGDPAARVVVILPASLIDPLDQAETRLALHRLVDLDEQALSRLVVARGARSREAVRATGGAWKVEGGDSEEAYLAEVIARAAFRLVPADFARADKASTLTAAGKLTFSAGSAPAVDLELYTGSGDELWIATRLTRGMLARVSPGAARRLLDAIDQLLPP